MGEGDILRRHLHPGIVRCQDQGHHIPTKMDVRVMVQLFSHRPDAIREDQGGRKILQLKDLRNLDPIILPPVESNQRIADLLRKKR